MLRIKELREKEKLSQLQLAEKLNLTQQAISLYEKGEREPGIDLINQLADFFGVTTDYLLGKSNIRNIEELKKMPFANAGGINVDGLDEEDLIELQRQADYIKDMKKKLKGEK